MLQPGAELTSFTHLCLSIQMLRLAASCSQSRCRWVVSMRAAFVASCCVSSLVRQRVEDEPLMIFHYYCFNYLGGGGVVTQLVQ